MASSTVKAGSDETRLRRSSRKRSSSAKVHLITSLEDLDADSQLRRTATRSSSKSPNKRKSLCEEEVDDDVKYGLKRSPVSKKQKRGFAPPDTYAHLAGLPDHLKMHLDVLFCGINPGQRSSQVGHHFAHPTNQFWACLHLANFTNKKLSSTEDYILPETFNIGLTNLVDRPTACESELSAREMKLCVPAFLAKISCWRPRIVCFVGMNISRIAHGEPKLGLGLSNAKLVHKEDQIVKETLFFTVPSTSGLVVQYPLPIKAKWFKELNDCLHKVKTSELDTSQMRVLGGIIDEKPVAKELDTSSMQILRAVDDKLITALGFEETIS